MPLEARPSNSTNAAENLQNLRRVRGKRHLPSGFGINLPLSPVTDQRRYPMYEYQEYPKILTAPCDKDYIDRWRTKNGYYDERSGQYATHGVSPRLGSLQPILSTVRDVELGLAEAVDEPLTVYNPKEEETAREVHGLEPMSSAPRAQVERVPIEPEVDEAKVDEEELRLLREQNAMLKKQLKAAAGAPTPARTVSEAEADTADEGDGDLASVKAAARKVKAKAKAKAAAKRNPHAEAP